MSGFIKRKISTIETLGEKLEKHRRNLGLSLDKAGRAININVRYLRYLENNQYEKLPADIYTLNILKSYAELLQLNPATVLDIFNQEKALFTKTQKKNKSLKLTKAQKYLNAILSPKTLKYIIIILLLVSVFSYIGWGINHIISAPMLTISEPGDNLITETHKITISGETEKEVNLNVNNRPVLIDQEGLFSLDLDLQKGLNLIKISARKKYSKENTIYRQVIVK